MAQIELNKPSEALATLEKARQKFPQSFAMEFYTGTGLQPAKGLRGGPAALHRGRSDRQGTDPSQLNEGFYFQLGAACERKGDYAQAEKYFEKCLQLAPDFAEALNYLGYMWAEHGMKLEQGAGADREGGQGGAEERRLPGQPGLGAVQAEPAKEALPYALKAAELSEQPDATVFDHLGDIYAALKQPEKAREAWRKSLALEPNEEVRKKLESSGAKVGRGRPEVIRASHGLPVPEALHPGGSPSPAADPTMAEANRSTAGVNWRNSKAGWAV